MTPAKFYALTAAVCVSLIILLALGTWQVQRMYWKQDLLDRLDTRAQAVPVSLDAAIAQVADSPDEARFLRVELRGRYRHEGELHLYGIVDKKPGWRVTTPLMTAAGRHVMVIRGSIPDTLKQATDRTWAQPQGDVSVVGRVRLGETQGAFMPDNAPAKNQWYWRDLGAMTVAALGADAKPTVGFYVELEAADHDGEWPMPAPVSAADLHNRHFGYALTWYGLAAALLAVYGVACLGRRKA